MTVVVTFLETKEVMDESHTMFFNDNIAVNMLLVNDVGTFFYFLLYEEFSIATQNGTSKIETSTSQTCEYMMLKH